MQEHLVLEILEFLVKFTLQLILGELSKERATTQRAAKAIPRQQYLGSNMVPRFRAVSALFTPVEAIEAAPVATANTKCHGPFVSTS